MKNSYSFILLVLMLLLGECILASQTNEIKSKKFDRNHWKEITKKIDYTEQEVKQKENSTQNNLDFSIPGFSIGILKLLVYVVAILVLIYILYFFISKVALSNKADKSKSVNIEDIENEHIDNLDLSALLKKALEQSNYKLAIRIQFLITLKKLSDTKKIEWKKEKTNYDYVQELSKWKLIKEFSFLTSIFNSVWYNKNEVDLAIYTQTLPHFDLVNKHLDTTIDKK
ncbi:MAG: hypothetical protein J0M08_13110 [Bacteroidetes bacterium]|nr:hypothetical protein [Bacteroidota bacterium]